MHVITTHFVALNFKWVHWGKKHVIKIQFAAELNVCLILKQIKQKFVF